MKDKTLETLGERKVKVEDSHIGVLRNFWKKTLEGKNESDILKNIGGVEKPDMLEDVLVRENSNLNDEPSKYQGKSDNENVKIDEPISFNMPEIVSPSFVSDDVNDDENQSSIDISNEDSKKIEQAESELPEFELPNIISHEGDNSDDNSDLSNIELPKLDDIMPLEGDKNEEIPEIEQPTFEYSPLEETSDTPEYEESEVNSFNGESNTSYGDLTDVNVNNKYDEINACISNLQSAVDIFKDQVDDLTVGKNNEIKSLNDEVSELTQNLRSEEAKSQALEDDNLELARDNRNINSKLESERNRRVNAENTVTELNNKLRKKDGQIVTLKSNISRVESKLGSSIKEISSLKEKINRQNEENRQVRLELNAEKEKNTTLERELSKREAEIERLKNQIKGFKTNVSSALSDLRKDKEKDDKKKIVDASYDNKTHLSADSPAAAILPGDVIDAFENVSKKGRSR